MILSIDMVQLADDTTIFVKDLKSFELSINAFLKFEKIAGLKLNLEKCEIIELGQNFCSLMSQNTLIR